MMFYVEDLDGRVLGKFDGLDIELEDGRSRHEVESVTELSSVVVDEWHDEY